MPEKNSTCPARPEITDAQLEQIRAQAKNLRYGSLTLIFQDGVLVQIDRSEKIRINKP